MKYALNKICDYAQNQSDYLDEKSKYLLLNYGFFKMNNIRNKIHEFLLVNYIFFSEICIFYRHL